MRILAIGLGGAGGRIVDHLYRTDRRSSKVACVQALAVDVDAASIGRLTGITDTAKICFSPLDVHHTEAHDREKTAIIDIAEIASRVNTLSTGETDAIILFLGLGGSMADAAPNLITTLRSSITEPIFVLVTLPCRSEGARISSKAADDIEMIAPLVDGMIVFDNETWRKKVKVSAKKQSPSDEGLMARIGLLKKRKEPELSPREQLYSLLNDAIVRRISLILRAGEFKADGGLDLAEVVLDSGEILNTMRGMGLITIGYAVEQVPSGPLDFIGRLRPGGHYADEHMKKASRIVDLAKQAIYNEISAPCDITSAHKALVLIAGPSHELSMKGFMTVRKWIDRSIAGLETRSGDYPVTSTKYVAIIIMLSGLGNIPRITELKEIRSQFRSRAIETPPQPVPADDTEETIQPAPPAAQRDEMITLPRDEREPALAAVPVITEEGKAQSGGVSDSDLHALRAEPIPEDFPKPQSIKTERPPVASRPAPPPALPRTEKPASSFKHLLKPRATPVIKVDLSGMREESKGTSEQERQKIGQELQKQRELAIHGARKPESPVQGKARMEGQEAKARHHARDEQEIPPQPRQGEPPEPSPKRTVVVKKQAATRVIIHKKTGRREGESQDAASRRNDIRPGNDPQDDGDPPLQASRDPADPALLDSWIQDVRSAKKNQQREGGILRIDENPATVNDDALLHSRLKRESLEERRPEAAAGQGRKAGQAPKKRSRNEDEDDLSLAE